MKMEPIIEKAEFIWNCSKFWAIYADKPKGS